ncbi:unnamed protein product [Linum trigynum]|uniref:Uncharacterized protein n=1 Tax=Linum trigynum TaxID=586398 RepID=A0AAV2EZW1_9ROSI
MVRIDEPSISDALEAEEEEELVDAAESGEAAAAEAEEEEEPIGYDELKRRMWKDRLRLQKFEENRGTAAATTKELALKDRLRQPPVN